MERFKLAVKSGDPVNAPIWWVDPTDKIAQSIFDEFMLGDTILVAPVIVEEAISRDVYVPVGKWKDGNSDTVVVRTSIYAIVCVSILEIYHDFAYRKCTDKKCIV